MLKSRWFVQLAPNLLGKRGICNKIHSSFEAALFFLSEIIGFKVLKIFFFGQSGQQWRFAPSVLLVVVLCVVLCVYHIYGGPIEFI